MYDEAKAKRAINFINLLKHTKGKWHGIPFDLLPWQQRIISDIFGTVKPNGYRQYNTAYVEIPKKNGKSELAAGVALYLTCGDLEWGAEVYGCASDRQQASIVFDVAVDMVEQCPSLKKRIKPVMSVKRLVYKPTNSFYQVLSSEAFIKESKPQQETILLPPALIKGRVTPVKGRMSVVPNTFKAVWNNKSPAAAEDAIK